jgi:CRISPR-associated endoribonuclease Cas6
LTCEPGAAIPWNWRDFVQPVIYEFIDDSGAIHSARYSLFTFSLLPLEPLFSPDGFGSESGMWVLRFASALPWALEAVSRGIRKCREIRIADVALRPAMVMEEAIVGRATYQTGAPILAAKLKERGFWTPGQNGFAEAVAKSLANRWAFLTREEIPAETIKFSFLGPPRQKLIQYRRRDLLAFSGTVVLEAPKELQAFAGCVGLGQKPSCGFGFLL